MMVVFANTAGEGLVIFPTHRVVRELPELNGNLRITPIAAAHKAGGPPRRGRSWSIPPSLLYRREGAALVESPGDDRLDTVVLEHSASRSRYPRRADEAVALVDGARQRLVPAAPPEDEQVRAVPRRGGRCQKSTYFYPKLISGGLL